MDGVGLKGARRVRGSKGRWASDAWPGVGLQRVLVTGVGGPEALCGRIQRLPRHWLDGVRPAGAPGALSGQLAQSPRRRPGSGLQASGVA